MKAEDGKGLKGDMKAKSDFSRPLKAKNKNTFEQEDLKTILNNNIDNILLKNPKLNEKLKNSIKELKESNNSLIQAELNLTDLENDEKNTIDKLNSGLSVLQTAIIQSQLATIKSDNDIEKLTKNTEDSKSKINKLTSLLNEITNQFNALSKTIVPTQTRGGSISTNNSIRRQIFTDLKYITKYLKYKTKYIVFKSKH